MSREGEEAARGGAVGAAFVGAVLRGLDAALAERPAADVLAEVAWDGPPLDPERMTAGDFLSLL